LSTENHARHHVNDYIIVNMHNTKKKKQCYLYDFMLALLQFHHTSGTFKKNKGKSRQLSPIFCQNNVSAYILGWG
jgi:hypothetical protein